MELRHLEYFIAVAEELHFGRAALRLQMTQPPLSQQIQQLETEIGVQLFQRSKRHVELTQAGTVFLHEARKVLSQLQLATERAQRAARGQLGRLVIGFVGSATYDVLPAIIRVYREKFPNVDVVLQEFATPLQLKGLHDGQIDVGFVRPPIVDETLSAETIERTHCVAAVPKNHPLARSGAVSLREFSEEPFVALSREIWPGFYDEIIRLCRQTGFSLSIRQEATEFQTIIGLVAAGIGVSIVPASARNIHVHDVVYVDIAEVAPSVEMAVAWRTNDSSLMVHEFVEVVREVTRSRSL